MSTPEPIPVDQVVRSKRKTLTLIVRNDGSLVVRAPLRTPDELIRQFVQKNVAWIEKKQAEVRERVLPAPKEYEPGETFLFLGNPYPLEIVKQQRQPLVLDGSFQLAESHRGRAATVFERWYRAQARRILAERVEFFASQYGLHYKSLRITSARTRWGSCSASGALSFSWRLVLAPLEKVDYVVVHELVHTVHHNHSKRFWNKVAKIMPDYKVRKKWLRRNGQDLMI